MQRASARIESLLDAMTLQEKIGQLTMLSPVPPGLPGAVDIEAAVRSGATGNLLNIAGAERTGALQRIARQDSRLGIPLLFGLDVVHGHRTIFPVPLSETAAFDPDLWERTAAAAAAEARRDGIAVTFAPMLDIARDPRWGRIAEGPGEDPWLGALFARAKVRGFQGRAPGDLSAPDRIAATAKHFVAYGAAIAGRDYNSVDISPRALRTVYLPPFRAAVEEGVALIMPAFVDLAGLPMSASRELLTGLLRERWGFESVLVSDYSAVAELVPHGVAADLPEAAALALRAGIDIDMMGFAYQPGLEIALARGMIRETEIDASVRQVLTLKERLGLFDEPLPVAVETEPAPLSARALAREAAVKSIVLAKNRQVDGRALLPLAAQGGPIAVIGPLARDRVDMLGPGSALGQEGEVADFVGALRAVLPDRPIAVAPGCGLSRQDEAMLDAALDLAAASDLVVLCLGEDRDMSGEGGSRALPGLPAAQLDLAAELAKLGRPTVLVLYSGRPLAVAEVVARADAVVIAGFPGSEAGPALADIATGAQAPSARLPVTWPAVAGQIPIHFGVYPIGRPANDADRFTSRYLDAPVAPLFPFGHGLGFTRFELGDITLERERIAPGEGVTVEVSVRNAGPRAGRVTLFLFIRDPVALPARPVLELRGVRQVDLAAGETREIRFALTADDLCELGAEPGTRPEPGLYHVLAGLSADPAGLRMATLSVSEAAEG